MKSITCALAAFSLSTFVSLGNPAGWPSSFSGEWRVIGRATLETSPGAITISDGLAVTEQNWKDFEFSFRARNPEREPSVQVWSAVRVKDRVSRYAVGYRGGIEPQLSMARYAPDGQARFLGWMPLDPVPKPGEWVRIRVVASGSRFHVYLNDEPLPRLNVEDKDAPWSEGGVGLGGGWLPTEFADPHVVGLDADKQAEFAGVGDRVWAPPALDKAAERVRQRAAYQPARMEAIPMKRQSVALDGNWLFTPDYELGAGEAPEQVAALEKDDQSWHVLSVPSFWTPTLGWLHGEFGLSGLKDAAGNKGPSDKLVGDEFARVNALTFDWRKTKSGWYRHHLDLPADLKGRNFELVFDAVAKVAEVWVNGQRVTSSVGMFREVRVDITKYLQPGKNVIAVHVIGNPDRQVKDAKKVADVAVTVEVTYEMLNSLPHGMTDNNSGGIWQPVQLLVTDPVRIDDVQILPALDGMSAIVEVENRGAASPSAALSYRIVDAATGQLLCASSAPLAVAFSADGKGRVEIKSPAISPKPWSPESPALYRLELDLSSGGKVVDQIDERFGFRTFAARDGKLILNGKPFWLRGGNHFPVTLRPNDGKLARVFTKLAKEGNVNITRSHGIPFTKAWFDAADEIGMGVSYEGTWPWLMLNGPTPDAELMRVWNDEFASLIKRYRNHPSLLFWTVNNEMQFYKKETLGPEVLKEKWTILDGMIREMRTLDPTRPIVPDSAYTRKETEKKFPGFRESNGFDDGDIDDAHAYYGWYNESPFHLFDGRFGNSNATPGRPLISQEMSTGYPRNDDWPSRSYQFPRYVPQALVGNDAYEGSDPRVFMTRQAFMTKEVAEAIRRSNRSNSSGVLHFAYLTWFTNVWNAESIRPKLTYYALQAALQPVLVSAELYGRHFYAGDSIKHNVSLINDSATAENMGAGQLRWRLIDGDREVAKGETTTPPVSYYSNEKIDLTIPVPAALPSDRIDAKLEYEWIVGGKTVSKNDYDVVLATKSWAEQDSQRFAGLIFDPQGRATAATRGLNLRALTDLDDLKPGTPLIIGDLAAALKLPAAAEKIGNYVAAGGKVLILQGGTDLTTLFPDEIKSFRKAPGEIVTMEIPESPIFSGLEPLDLSWFDQGERKLPLASSGTYQVDRERSGVTVLAGECKLHPDIPKDGFFAHAGTPIVLIERGTGCVLASEMLLSAKDRDPIAGRLLANMLQSLK